MTGSESKPIIEIAGLCKTFPGRDRSAPVNALESVDLTIFQGETLGLVGESGSGKSTLARILVGLVHPDEGEVRLLGRILGTLNRREWRQIRRSVQMVFQDPAGSLNPRMTVGEAIRRPIVLSGDSANAGRRVAELLELVGLRPEQARRYPNELSGGQQQRVGIARALASRPAVVVLDEPTSALDVSVQAQILNLLGSLQTALGLTFLFISHNLGVVRHLSDRIAVLYRGHLLEVGDAETLTERPAHPYTRLLLGSVPKFYGRSIEPCPPPASRHEAGTGCPFAARCVRRTERCVPNAPRLSAASGPGHVVACFHPYP